VFIGVDGGGSKTAFALVDREGVIRASHITSGSYYLSIGLKALDELISTSLDVLLDEGGVTAHDVEFAFFGFPAYGEDRPATAEMDRFPSRRLRSGSYACGNDMVCGWAGSLASKDGINVVAGTGSICYGERNGTAARCGGWGELFSDEGSAYWIACRGLDLFARMSDGRAARGPLYALMRERLRLADDLDVCAHVYVRLAGDRAQIAQLCPLVFDAATSGDVGAKAILDQAANELALMVDSTRTYSGGVFRGGGADVLKYFTSALAARGDYRLCEPLFPPVIGAALYAAKRFGQPLSDAALARLHANRKQMEALAS
jgi:N-acetylglucosamine kinase-like BadF-type ATPase